MFVKDLVVVAEMTGQIMLFKTVWVFVHFVAIVKYALKPWRFLLILMYLHMLLQVSIACKSFLTNFTHEWSIACMDPVMPY